MKRLSVQPAMCATCPWREGSQYAALRNNLEESAITEASRICHSTGSNAINHQTGKKPKLCRGARDFQILIFFRMGFIDAPTDEAWEKKCKQLGL